MDDLISKQAAIDIAKELIITLDGYEMNNQAVANYCIEITRLPSAQPEPCEDAVSRQAAIDIISQHTFYNDYDDTDKCSLLDGLRALPPVTPKQRTGHWYPVGIAEAVGGESAQWGSAIADHRCSECDEQALRDDFEHEVLSDFCPHCGRRMERRSE